jgi:hypothetical protein
VRNGRVAEVVHESDGEAYVQFPDGSEHHLATHRTIGIGNKVDLYPVPANRAELMALVLDRLPEARKGRLHTALTLEQNEVVMVLDDEHVVIQRRGPNEHGAIFDYSPEKVRQLLKRFFDEVNK